MNDEQSASHTTESHITSHKRLMQPPTAWISREAIYAGVSPSPSTFGNVRIELHDEDIMPAEKSVSEDQGAAASQYLPSDVFQSSQLPPAALRKVAEQAGRELPRLVPAVQTRRALRRSVASELGSPRHSPQGSPNDRSRTQDLAQRLRRRPTKSPNYALDLVEDEDEMFDGGIEIVIDYSVLDDPDLFQMTPDQAIAIQAAQYNVSPDTIRQWDAEDDEDHEPEDEDNEPAMLDALHDEASRLDAQLPDEDTLSPLAIDISSIGNISARDQSMQELLEALSKGWHEAVDKLLELEIEHCDFSPARVAEIKCHVYMMLISIDNTIFQGLVRGDLDRRYQEDEPTQQALNKLWERARQTGQPAIYRNSLIDDDGFSPTPAEFLHVCDLIEKDYLSQSDGQFANDIDNFRAPAVPLEHSALGQRKYLTKGGRAQSPPTVSRKERIKLFIKRLRARVATIPLEERDDPLAAPLVEIGYSIRVFKRLACHRGHQGSNLVMNLFEAAFDVVYPNQYRIHQHIIHLIFLRIQSVLGEIVLTRLSQGYIFNAGGFSFHPAGRSNESAYHCSDDKYREWRDWALEHSAARSNHKTYRELRPPRPNYAEVRTQERQHPGSPIFRDPLTAGPDDALPSIESASQDVAPAPEIDDMPGIWKRQNAELRARIKLLSDIIAEEG